MFLAYNKYYLAFFLSFSTIPLADSILDDYYCTFCSTLFFKPLIANFSLNLDFYFFTHYGFDKSDASFE